MHDLITLKLLTGFTESGDVNGPRSTSLLALQRGEKIPTDTIGPWGIK